MADIKEDIGHAQQQHLNLTVEAPKMEEKEEEREQMKTKRVASLDIFRGLTVAVCNLSFFSFFKF